MSDDTPLLNLPLIQPAQAQKHVTHNEALRLLDITVQLAVLDRDLNAPPATPAEGDRFIIGPAPTGAWAGRAGQIAAFWGGIWTFLPPRDGWHARVLDESVTLAHQGGLWSPIASLSETTPRLGIATTPDATNRLAVAAPASLFTHSGAGHQVKVNKATATDNAALLFQTGWSGRAEIGLAGTDALSIKVSGDGTTFTTALTADAATGRISAPQGLLAPLHLRDTADPTKAATVDLSTLPTGTQRSYTLPDVSSEIAALAGTQTFTGAKTFAGPLAASGTTVTLGTSTDTASHGLGTGATASGKTKTVQIGTAAAAGSTTTIAIGPSTPGAGGTLTLHSPTVTLGATVTQFDMGSASARATALGIGGATADGTTRLSVNSPMVLFNHAGSGTEASVNKANAAAQALLSFRSDGTPRAQLGLIGNDEFSLRVSPDGSSFTTALSINEATARVSLAQPAILGGLSADPATLTDGTLWHNATTGHVAMRLGGRSFHLDGQQDLPFLLPPSGELITTTSGTGSLSTGTVTGAADRAEIFPFTARADMAIDRALVNCTTGVAGSLARVLAYASDANGRPTTLLAESGDLDLSTIGNKTATLALSLRQGRTIWIGLRTSSTATYSAWPPSGTPDLNGGTAPVTGLRKLLRRTVAWSSQAPATWGYAATELGSSAAPAIWLRIA